MEKVIETIEKGMIKAQLDWDIRVDASDVEVHVEDGHVRLTGTVSTFVERMLASEIVWRLRGIYSVSNELTVKPRKKLTAPKDAQIKAHLGNVMDWHPTLDTSDIELIVNKGHVEVDGTVQSYWEKLIVETIITNTAGVTKLSNRLAVVPKDDAADEATAKDIMDALHRSQSIDAGQINVKVQDGHVYLSGNVQSRDAYQQAHDVASFTFGVIDVNNDLSIDANN